ncbi:hypothetical protein GLN3_01700 [Geobacillus lituanicus]|nr:hypothetical protein GLN3_01700 [Geobacillus lituanicus]OQP15605.1 hypothetical protein B1693_12675 [Geobacillus zalihae]
MEKASFPFRRNRRNFLIKSIKMFQIFEIHCIIKVMTYQPVGIQCFENGFIRKKRKGGRT